MEPSFASLLANSSFKLPERCWGTGLSASSGSVSSVLLCEVVDAHLRRPSALEIRETEGPFKGIAEAVAHLYPPVLLARERGSGPKV